MKTANLAFHWGANLNIILVMVKVFTAQKLSVFKVFLVRIFPHLEWILRDTGYLSVFSPNARKYRHFSCSDYCIMAATTMIASQKNVWSVTGYVIWREWRDVFFYMFFKVSKERSETRHYLYQIRKSGV